MDNKLGFQKKHFDAVENRIQKPNRLESIKERLDNLGAGKVVKYDNSMNLATQYAMDYKLDVEYLFQRLERYEKALELAIKHIDGRGEIFSEREKVPVLFQLRESLKEE